MRVMGKRQVKNEAALKEIRLPEEGELFGTSIENDGWRKCHDKMC